MRHIMWYYIVVYVLWYIHLVTRTATYTLWYVHCTHMPCGASTMHITSNTKTKQITCGIYLCSTTWTFLAFLGVIHIESQQQNESKQTYIIFIVVHRDTYIMVQKWHARRRKTKFCDLSICICL